MLSNKLKDKKLCKHHFLFVSKKPVCVSSIATMLNWSIWILHRYVLCTCDSDKFHISKLFGLKKKHHKITGQTQMI